MFIGEVPYKVGEILGGWSEGGVLDGLVGVLAGDLGQAEQGQNSEGNDLHFVLIIIIPRRRYPD